MTEWEKPGIGGTLAVIRPGINDDRTWGPNPDCVNYHSVDRWKLTPSGALVVVLRLRDAIDFNTGKPIETTMIHSHWDRVVRHNHIEERQL